MLDSKIFNVLLMASVLFGSMLFFHRDSRDIIIDIFAGITGNTIAEKPRDTAPVDEFTQYFDSFEIPVRNKIYTYHWYQPDKPWPDKIKFPLILVLHDGYGKAHAAKFLISKAIAAQHPAFILIPMLSAGRQWASASEPDKAQNKHALRDTVNIVKNISSIYPIDMARIYILGCSGGGTGVYSAARHYSDFFAAGVTFSGQWDPPDGVNMTNMPLWAIHGEIDAVVPAEYPKTIVEIINSRGGNARYKELKGVEHDCSSGLFYTPDVWEWLFSHKKP